METKKTKLKPRRMWANPLDAKCPPVFWHLSRVRLESINLNHTVPVAVIPLDDVEKLVKKASNAYAFEDVNFTSLTDCCIRAALTAIGVLPRARKGRK
jgi:hypothetical protein